MQPRKTVLLVIVNPADACWTGGSIDASPKTDDLALHGEMPEARFPLIG